MTYIHQMLVSKELGGAGLIGIHLASFLRMKGQEYCLWIPGEGAALRKIQQSALKFNTYDTSCVFSASKMKALVGNWKIWRNFHPYRPGIVHIHSPYYYKALQMGLQMSGLKTVVHIHLQEAAAGLRWTFEQPPDVIITCARTLAEFVRQTLPERCREQQRIISVPNAVDLEWFFPGDKAVAKQRVGAPHSIPLVLMVANLAPHKGQETAIRATAVLKRAGVDIVCWLAGVERQGGEGYTTRLQVLCNELKVADRIQFLGQRDDVSDLLRAADIFVLPSTSEGLPLSVLEAQATKVPVLAAPTAGIPEVIIDGKTGFLIPAQDIVGYAQRIESLLRHPEISHRVTEQAYTQVTKEHNWHTYCETIWMLYQSLWDEPAYGTVCTVPYGAH
jgi:glycosyltransferase involved in cell wall biosynthesis